MKMKAILLLSITAIFAAFGFNNHSSGTGSKSVPATAQKTATQSSVDKFSTGSPDWLGNKTNESFSKAKKNLMDKVYGGSGNDFYCGCKFSGTKIDLSSCPSYTGRNADGKFSSRDARVEFEHVVPAENFGRAFKEWRDGSDKCVKNGKAFKGRECAEQENKEFRLVHADMYNLKAALGEANAVHSNDRFGMIVKGEPKNGCYASDGKSFQPKGEVMGQVARTYLYMDTAYPKFGFLSSSDKKQFEAFDKMYPVTAYECDLYKKIKRIQGNENPILKARCQ